MCSGVRGKRDNGAGVEYLIVERFYITNVTIVQFKEMQADVLFCFVVSYERLYLNDLVQLRQAHESTVIVDPPQNCARRHSCCVTRSV